MFQSFKTETEPEKSFRRLQQLRRRLKGDNLTAFIIPLTDEHMNEYLPASARRLEWLTGFSGSAGAAVILPQKAVLFVDGRYTLQAAQQCDMEIFTIEHLLTCPPAKWLGENLPKGAKLGFDPWLHSIEGAQRLKKACTAAGAKLTACKTNPIDEIWQDRPAAPAEKITRHRLKYAGVSSRDKLARLQQILCEAETDAAIITLTDSIAWAFNIRGNDVPHNPIALAYAIITRSGAHQLFVNPEKLTPSTSDYLKPLTSIHRPESLTGELKKLGKAKKTIRLDPATCPYAIWQALKTSGAKIKKAKDPCIALKAIKNEAEQTGARAAHIRDGAALSRFLCWLDKNAETGNVSEISAAKKLEYFRAETGRLKDISFDTISGSGPNGAIVHYRVSEQSNRKLQPGELYLVDSGGQYEDGTTDVTRTIAIGSPPTAAMRHFTLVLKGHIALARARFPGGTSGAQLDALARTALWRAGLDYDHGTGHGVGSYLSVPEGPQGISKRAHTALEPGMILSIEPGYYREGKYGIRIENLVLVSPPQEIKGGQTPMLGFEPLTLAPIDLKLIEPSMLTLEEKAWLNAYHRHVLKTLGSLLKGEEKIWLEAATRPI